MIFNSEPKTIPHPTTATSHAKSPRTPKQRTQMLSPTESGNENNPSTRDQRSMQPVHTTQGLTAMTAPQKKPLSIFRTSQSPQIRPYSPPTTTAAPSCISPLPPIPQSRPPTKHQRTSPSQPDKPITLPAPPPPPFSFNFDAFVD